MRFLRMLTNSLLAGALGAAYLTVLVLQLNPQIPIMSSTTWRWYVTLGMLYGVHLAVTFYVLMVVREFFALDVFSPGWASVRMLAWMGAAAAAVAAALMWLNVRGFSAALTDEAASRMTAGAVATTASAVALLVIAIAHYSFGRRGGRVGASLFVMAAFGSLALPLAARGRAVDPPAPISLVAHGADTSIEAPPGPRVFMLLLDGASLDYILPRVAEGRLPAFARLLDKGLVMDLATVRPTQPDVVWAAAATGMYPAKNGVRSAGSYYARGDERAVDLLPDYCFSHALVQLGFVRNQPNMSTVWRARPLWSIVSSAGLPVGVVRWPLTYPAESVNGFIVSDRFHQLVGSIAEFDRAASPPGILAALLAAFTTTTPESGALPPPGSARFPGPELTEGSAMRRDRFYGTAFRELSRQIDPRFSAVRYDGLDAMGHYYLSATLPRALDAAADEERRRALQRIDAYYGFVDGELDIATGRMGPDDLLAVVSGFGMQPLDPVKRTIARLLGDPDFSGTHERAPDGFMLAYGAAVQPGRRPRGSIVDVAPTLLYFLGLPIARDMDGFARTDLFTRDYTAERPIVFIPSYSR
jgi:predicted AlkP superfamily pyrophosphatase or phosphodiesterase